MCSVVMGCPFRGQRVFVIMTLLLLKLNDDIIKRQMKYKVSRYILTFLKQGYPFKRLQSILVIINVISSKSFLSRIKWLELTVFVFLTNLSLSKVRLNTNWFGFNTEQSNNTMLLSVGVKSLIIILNVLLLFL